MDCHAGDSVMIQFEKGAAEFYFGLPTARSHSQLPTTAPLAMTVASMLRVSKQAYCSIQVG
jgi:hypothetical protein